MTNNNLNEAIIIDMECEYMLNMYLNCDQHFFQITLLTSYMTVHCHGE